MNKILGLGIAVLAVMALWPTGQAEAASNYYYAPSGYQYQTSMYGGTPMNTQELIAYLKQLIAQLQAQQSNQTIYTSGYPYGYGSNYYGYTIGEPRGSSSHNNDDDEPDVETDSASSIEKNEAELRGSVEMNDFEDGEVFFVYGEDEDQVEDVEDEYDSYSDIDEDGDDLQKVRVDSSLDDDEDYEETVTGLDADTDYFFQICVGYEDEDDDEVIVCGGVDEFTTDKN